MLLVQIAIAQAGCHPCAAEAAAGFAPQAWMVDLLPHSLNASALFIEKPFFQ